MTAENWLLDVKVRISGRGRMGADGMVRKIVLYRIDSSVVDL